MSSARRVAEALAAWGGSPVVDLLIGEPCFDTPEPLRDALARAARCSASAYGPMQGLTELREVLARRARSEGLEVGADGIVITHGAKGGLLAVLATLLAPGDEVIVPVPGYPGTRVITTRLGATPVEVPEIETGLEGWADAVVRRMGDRTRAVVVASPSNPSGAVLPTDDLVRLAHVRSGVRGSCSTRRTGRSGSTSTYRHRRPGRHRPSSASGPRQRRGRCAAGGSDGCSRIPSSPARWP